MWEAFSWINNLLGRKDGSVQLLIFLLFCGESSICKG